MSVLFVTGAGTEIGKTYVTCALARQLRAAGRAVRAFKPVATGMVEPDDPAFQHSDAAQLLAAQGLPHDETTIAACTPWRFAAPLSPDMAAAAEGHRLELANIVTWALDAIQQVSADTVVLIEGVGGVMSPIASDGLNIDLIAALACPAILVGGSYLGAINHTLTALAAMRARGVDVLGLVVNETFGSPVDFAATVASFARFGPDVALMTLRHGEASIGGMRDLLT
ncbi:MAG: dethiobiotin synthase [Xanthobacteraceae bacterium]|nr:dethiobiotin synthase [Xanthobacteraceae bacterium]